MPATPSMLRAAGRREPRPAQGIRCGSLSAKGGQLSVPTPSLLRVVNLNMAQPSGPAAGIPAPRSTGPGETGPAATVAIESGLGGTGLGGTGPVETGPGETAPGDTAAAETSASLSLSLSPSRAGDFLTCPLLYRFRVIDRLPEPPSSAAARGTLVHAVLERLFDQPPAR